MTLARKIAKSKHSKLITLLLKQQKHDEQIRFNQRNLQSINRILCQSRYNTQGCQKSILQEQLRNFE
jgi:hypothetical protein